MIKIALCDNDERALPVIAGAVTSAFQTQKLEVKVAMFLSGKELLAAMQSAVFQIVFLDIDMPELDGIEVGKKIRQRSETVEIVYVSECEERVFEAFSVYPLGFVRKSNFLNDISDVVRLYIKKHARTQQAEQLKFSTRSKVVVLKRRLIQYIEGSGNYQLVYVNGQKEPVEIKMTMDKLEEALEPVGFIRVHKGYLVNYLYIQKIESGRVVLKGGAELPLGRSKVKEVRSRFLALVDA